MLHSPLPGHLYTTFGMVARVVTAHRPLSSSFFVVYIQNPRLEGNPQKYSESYKVIPKNIQNPIR